MDWTHQALNKVLWQAIVNMTTNLRILQQEGNFLTELTVRSF
jgi:hypothetical protein